METNYDQIAAQYKQAKHHPWRMHIEHFTLFELLGNLQGASTLDLACGEGFFTRYLRRAGAEKVSGVDLSAGMIDLALEEERQRPLGIEYFVHDVKTLRLNETFDVVSAAYLLNYARTRDELLEMALACTRHLKPGCRFVTVNNNPSQDPATFQATEKYGFTKTLEGELSDGAPVIYNVQLAEEPFTITNYYLDVATHEWALRTAGFREVRWHAPRVSPAGLAEFGADYWDDFLENQPIIFLECWK